MFRSMGLLCVVSALLLTAVPAQAEMCKTLTAAESAATITEGIRCGEIGATQMAPGNSELVACLAPEDVSSSATNVLCEWRSVAGGGDVLRGTACGTASIIASTDQNIVYHSEGDDGCGTNCTDYYYYWIDNYTYNASYCGDNPAMNFKIISTILSWTPKPYPYTSSSTYYYVPVSFPATPSGYARAGCQRGSKTGTIMSTTYSSVCLYYKEVCPEGYSFVEAKDYSDAYKSVMSLSGSCVKD